MQPDQTLQDFIAQQQHSHAQATERFLQNHPAYSKAKREANLMLEMLQEFNPNPPAKSVLNNHPTIAQILKKLNMEHVLVIKHHEHCLFSTGEIGINIRKLKESELPGVLTHELGHLKHNDLFYLMVKDILKKHPLENRTAQARLNLKMLHIQREKERFADAFAVAHGHGKSISESILSNAFFNPNEWSSNDRNHPIHQERLLNISALRIAHDAKNAGTIIKNAVESFSFMQKREKEFLKQFKDLAS